MTSLCEARAEGVQLGIRLAAAKLRDLARTRPVEARILTNAAAELES